MEKRKVISLFCHCFDPAKGGVEQVAKTFYEVLRKKNEVHVFTGQGDNLDSYKTFSTLNNTRSTETIHRLPLQQSFQRICNKFLNKIIFVLPFFSPWYFGPILQYGGKEESIIKRSDVLIGFGMPTKPFIDAADFAQKYQNPLMLLPAYHNVSYFNNCHPFQRAIMRAKKVFFLSKKEIEAFRENYHIGKEVIELLQFGYFSLADIKTQESKAAMDINLSKQQNITIGVIGQIAKRKNLEFYKRCIDLLSQEKNTKYHFLFAGAKTNTSPFIEKELSEYLGKNLTIEYDVLNLKDVYKKIDIILNPSFEESFGIANFEAMYYGKPVFIHKQSPLAPVFVENGLPVFSDEKEAVEKIKNSINDSSSYPAILKKQYVLLKNYSIDSLEKQITALLP